MTSTKYYNLPLTEQELALLKVMTCKEQRRKFEVNKSNRSHTGKILQSIRDKINAQLCTPTALQLIETRNYG